MLTGISVDWIKAQFVLSQPGRIDLTGNAGLLISPQQLHYSVTSSSLSFNDNLLCNNTFLANTTITLLLDPAQYVYSNCICFGDEEGHQRIWNPVSKSCIPVFTDTQSDNASLLSFTTSARVLVDSKVNDSSARMLIRKGFYPCLSPCDLNGNFNDTISDFSIWNLTQLQILECKQLDSCNPLWENPVFANLSNQNFAFQCSDGTEGFLCSQCKNGYFLSGSSCRKCFPGSEGLIPALTFLIVVLMLFALWKSGGQSQQASFSICFFFIQLLDLLPHSTESSSNNIFFSLFYFRPFAWECVSNSFDFASQLFVALGVVLSIPLLSFAAWALSYWSNARNLSEDLQQSCKVRNRAIEYCWSLAQFVYLPVAQTALSTFNCRKDNGPDYVLAAPYIECHRPMMVLIASITVATFAAPFPLLSFWRFYRARKDNGSDLFASLREGNKLWWWVPLVLNGRRVLIAVVISLTPSGSTALIPTVSSVLLANLILLLVAKPYKIRNENVLDAGAVTIASVLFSLISVNSIETSVIQGLATFFKAVALLIASVVLFSTSRIVRQFVGKFTKRQNEQEVKSPINAGESITDYLAEYRQIE